MPTPTRTRCATLSLIDGELHLGHAHICRPEGSDPEKDTCCAIGLHLSGVAVVIDDFMPPAETARWLQVMARQLADRAEEVDADTKENRSRGGSALIKRAAPEGTA